MSKYSRAEEKKTDNLNNMYNRVINGIPKTAVNTIRRKIIINSFNKFFIPRYIICDNDDCKPMKIDKSG